MEIKATWKRFDGQETFQGVADNEKIVLDDIEERFWEDDLAYHQDALKVASTMLQIQIAKRVH